MSTPPRLLLSTLVIAATLAGLVPAAGVAGASSPAVTVTVDGTAVGDGNRTLVESDPTVGVSVDANRSIQVVSVRVDGTTERRYTPNDTSFSASVDLGLRSGDHTLEVVVKTDAVTTHTVTVTKDTERPYVRYTSPFETDRYAPPPETATVNRSRVVLAGNFTDVTGVSHLRVLRTVEYDVGTNNRVDRQTYTASNLNGSFRQPIFLGVGQNNVTAWYYDELGHARKHEMRITVEDSAPPTLSGLSAVRVSPSTLRIRGRATDNGQIRSISVSPEDQPSTTYLVDPGIDDPDPTLGRVGFATNVSLSPGTTAVRINATDTAGNAVVRTVTVRRTVAPELRLDPTRTRYANRSTVVAAGVTTDGEIAAASVETVDPETGEVVDIVSLHDGPVVTDLSFERRLDAPADRTATVRLRVIDSSGTEHVASLNRTLAVETPTPTARPTPTATATPGPTATPTTATLTPEATTPAAANETGGITVPVLGVTVPIPSVLGTSITLPVPVVGPFDLPVLPVVALVVTGVGVASRVR